MHDLVDARTPHDRVPHRKRERLRRSQIARDAREGGVEGQDAKHRAGISGSRGSGASVACDVPIMLAGHAFVRIAPRSLIRDPDPDPCHDFLAILDRPRRHVHRYRRAPTRRRVGDAQAPVRESRAVSGRGSAGHSRAARRAGRGADAGRRHRSGQDGDDGRDERVARAQGRADGAGDHARLRGRVAHRLSESSEAVRAADRAAEPAVRAGHRGGRADRRARRSR